MIRAAIKMPDGVTQTGNRMRHRTACREQPGSRKSHINFKALDSIPRPAKHLLTSPNTSSLGCAAGIAHHPDQQGSRCDRRGRDVRTSAGGHCVEEVTMSEGLAPELGWRDHDAVYLGADDRVSLDPDCSECGV